MPTKEILEDLLSIEINTIKKAGMSARRPPLVPWQLMDIIGHYARYLENQLHISTVLVRTPDSNLLFKQGKSLADCTLELESCIDLTRYLNLADGSKDYSQITNGWTTFEKLRILAKHAYNGNVPTEGGKTSLALTEENQIILWRIRQNCDLIKAILKHWQNPNNKYGLSRYFGLTVTELATELANATKPPSFNHVQLSDLTTIRKIWEIGTESVLIQTVVQAEGDVITRISPSLIDPQIVNELRDSLFTVHRNATDTSLSHWKNLIGIVFELAGKLVSGK